jgi:hypothetical protein
MLKKNSHVIEIVDDCLHGVLSADVAAYVEQHCESCRICRVAMEEARERLDAVRTVPPVEAPERLIRETVQKLDDYQRKSARGMKIFTRVCQLAVAASVLIVGGLHLYYLNLSPSPYDLQVLGQSELLSGTHASLRVRLFDRKTKTPVNGVPVRLELRGKGPDQLVRLASFRTNAEGSGRASFKLPEWQDGEYQLCVAAAPGWGHEEITRTVKLKRSWRLMLSTDKPVYQPGQTILMRGLALRQPDLRPITGQSATFSITDPKGNVIFKQAGVTSRYGIASAECPLAGEIIEGPYAIECRVGDTPSKTTVEVKRYVLPKFRVDVTLDRPYYEPRQTVRGKARAAYFFGKPVADGHVSIEVGAIDIGPRTIISQTARTNRSGDAEFEFTLPERLIGREQESGDTRISLKVTITDSAGQKESRTASRVVTSQPLRLEVIPESGRLVPGLPNRIFALATYADGTPAKVRLAVSGLSDELTTNALGVASFEITPKPEPTDMALRAVDENGMVAQRSVTLQCGQGGREFIVRTDKAVYNGGETMRVVVLGRGSEPVFVDFIKNGQTILTESVPVANGRGDYAFDLPPEVFGTIELSAYRFGSAGLPVRKTRLIFVRQGNQLNIRTALDQPEYRPGNRARLVFTLTDKQGSPTPGALSLAAVDEAVFSVLEQRPGTEQTFFTLEQELLKPIYAIYPWSPDLTTASAAPDRNSLEQALFSRTSRVEPDAGPANSAEETRAEQERDATRFLRRPLFPQPSGRTRGGATGESGLGEQRPSDSRLLWGTTYPEKETRIKAEREQALDRLGPAWIAVLASAATIGVLWLFVMRCPGRALLVVLLTLVLFVPLLLPSMGRARAQARFSGVKNEVSGEGPAELKSLGYITANDGLAFRLDRDSKPAGPVEAQAPVRVRDWFPETLLWRPELITDDNGRASIDVDLADSITTWRLTASAVSADGRLGGSQAPIRVFQPFFVDLNLPVALTRGDEVAVPVVVYNYLDKPQTVELSLEDAGWFKRLEPAAKRIDLGPSEVRSTSYRFAVSGIGNHELQVTARGAGVADAIKRQIEVLPEGKRVEQVFNGLLTNPAEIALSVPADAIEGSAKAFLKIYPSSFSQLVEGLDRIFQMPYGCFEQTSSTTYPNILALDYLRRTNKSVPQVEAKARQYIHLGCQRLLSFEVAGGGFDWFGRPPANQTLTAYGLMEFEDMARVHDVDPRLIERTRQWLLSRRLKDGSWSPESHVWHEDPTAGGQLARLSTTAYVAWAVFGGKANPSDAPPTRDFLLSHSPDQIKDPYVLALVCNALAAMPQGREVVGPYVDRLNGMKHLSPDGKLAWWSQAEQSRTMFHGCGRSGGVETTSLAVLAMIRAGQNPGTVQAALAWLASQKDGSGTWHSTQATVLALKALIAGTGQPLGEGRERRIEMVWSDGPSRIVTIRADQGEVTRQIDLTEQIGQGQKRLRLEDRSETAAGYQVVLRYNVPEATVAKSREPLSIQLDYDRGQLKVGEQVAVTARIVNNMDQAAPMVILDLPIPAGFRVASQDFERCVGDGLIAKYQLTARSVIVYLRQLEPSRPLTLNYHIEATMPVKTAVPPARAYEYYDPDRQGFGAHYRLTVLEQL